ncbi:MAG: glyoxylate reductase [Sulfolobales archaeon]|nr:NAD(P)-binding domain-containing protein [Sulfolobales archaeon]MDW8010664.1 glyoxylate reductase [Sulfolobales archaeon]
MLKPKVFITRELFGESVDRISQYYEVDVWDRYHQPPYEVLLRKAREADALVSLLTDRIDCNLLRNSPRLRMVAQYAVGFDNIDVDCATRLGVYVTNTPGVLTEATAELTWALILAVSRRIVESDVFVRWGEWYRSGTAWHPKMMLGFELMGKVLGVVGLGRIGRRVAEIGARGFGMKIIYYDVVRNYEAEKEIGAEFRELRELLREADVVTIHVPLTPQTRYLIDESALRLMKKTAILINTARGAVVDTGALVKALREGWIAGAGLDVFEEEPLSPNHPLTALKNLVLVPHIGSATYEARRAMADAVADNLIAFYEGRVPPNLVNRDVVNLRSPGFSK